MKYLKPGIICLFIICICTITSAQKVLTLKEPEIKTARLFKDLPGPCTGKFLNTIANTCPQNRPGCYYQLI